MKLLGGSFCGAPSISAYLRGGREEQRNGAGEDEKEIWYGTSIYSRCCQYLPCMLTRRLVRAGEVYKRISVVQLMLALLRGDSYVG